MTNGNDGLYKGIFMKNVNLAKILKYSIMFYDLSTSNVIVQQLGIFFFFLDRLLTSHTLSFIYALINLIYYITNKDHATKVAPKHQWPIWLNPPQADGCYPTSCP